MAKRTAVEMYDYPPPSRLYKSFQQLKELQFVIWIGKVYIRQSANQIVTINKERHSPKPDLSTLVVIVLALGGMVNSFSIQHVLCYATMGSVKRTTFRQYLIYLGLNVIVSAITVVVVSNLFGGGGGSRAEEAATPTIDLLAQVASSFPTDTATLAPSPTPLTYQVQPGDTLGDIATRLGVPLQDLMEANDIEDPNELDVGQVLIIPVSAGQLSGGDSDADGQSDATTTPEPESSGAGVIISAVYEAAELQNESIRLFNTGGIVRMEGWTIDDGEGRTFTFPDFTFYSTGAVNVHTRSGIDTSIDLFWGLDEAIWEPGKVVTLKNSAGDVISTFPIPDA